MSDRRTGDSLPRIPQASPGAGYRAHRREIDAAISRVLESGRYVLGPEVEAFESEFGRYLGLDHAVGVASGTDALELALRALGIGPGDAVFTVSHTAVATVAAIEACGAAPVLVEIDPQTFTIDPERLARAIRSARLPPGTRPRAVVPVHLYGLPADMPAVVSVARAAGLAVVEDCAQSAGARVGDRPAGTWGDVAAFSFYPTKNLGALGDGGLIATDDATIASRARELREYGWRDRHVSAVPGVNSRLDELQAAVLRVKLPHLDAENERRRAVAAAYSAALGSATVELPATRSGAHHVFHQYVVRSPERGALARALAAAGIETAIHYPVPVHLQPGYAGRAIVADDLEITERIAGEILSLPVFPELDRDSVDRICRAVLDWASVRAVPGASG